MGIVYMEYKNRFKHSIKFAVIFGIIISIITRIKSEEGITINNFYYPYFIEFLSESFFYAIGGFILGYVFLLVKSKFEK